jgi:hypothetical protein
MNCQGMLWIQDCVEFWRNWFDLPISIMAVLAESFPLESGPTGNGEREAGNYYLLLLNFRANPHILPFST